MIKAIGFAAKGSHSHLKPFEFERNEPRANEVQIEVLFCGVCHSDIHQVKNEWHNTVYPCLPGHEIVGKVTNIGSKVTKFKVGDIAGVGCMIDSCHKCPQCLAGQENYCEVGFTATYNGNMRTPTKENLTFGGYSNAIVVREDFVLRVPPNLDLAAAAPIMCAGVTTFSPLRHWGVKKGSKVGIVGLGGLGHMATKLAVAMGAEVTIITTSPEKKNDAYELGAKKIIVSNDSKDMEANEKTLDFILSTIPQPHDVNPYMKLLNTDGVLTIVGCIAPLQKPLDLSALVPDRKTLGTSLIGSIRETQDVLDFCAQNRVQPNVRIIDIEKVNDSYEEVEKKHADFRYVIDMKTLAGKKMELGFFEKIGL